MIYTQGTQTQYKINRNVSWAALKHNIIKLFLTEEPEKI